jgi:hypothetical protein
MLVCTSGKLLSLSFLRLKKSFVSMEHTECAFSSFLDSLSIGSLILEFRNRSELGETSDDGDTSRSASWRFGVQIWRCAWSTIAAE